MDRIIEEFKHLSGVGPSLLEKVSADPMLGVLAKAFSVKAVKPADVKYLLYRRVGQGVELEDQAARLGGILTSVESSEADPKALLVFLKKHGAKPAPKVEQREGSVYRVLGPGAKAGDDTDVVKFCAAVTKGVQSVVRGKFFRCVPNLKFGVGGANIDYANIPATAQPGSLDFLNAKVQVRLMVDGFDAEGNLKGAKIRVEKLGSHGIKVRAKTGTVDQVVKHIVTTIKKATEVTEALEEAKSGFEVQIIHSKSNPDVVKVEVTGTFRGEEIVGRSTQIHLGIDRMRHGWVTLDKEMTITRPDSGKKVPDGLRTKIVKAALAKLVPLAHKVGNKEFAESIENGPLSESVAATILKQMGGPGRLKMMIGAKHFIDHGKSLSFQFPNRQRSKGNYVKITLRPDDTYDMEFLVISGGGTKVKKVKTYSGITFDQLQPLFTQWTGLHLKL